ncbi:hypothetical protein ACH5RR_039122 [Cinchona calisaya]|uniref:Uncharacterized protein n=1 Tax=Cinchona calisaya TaxID=153742 RepID=A0ABD2Y2U7_9GENT
MAADLGIEDDYKWTIMSDKQKGLIQACELVLPNAQHRFCARHLQNNWCQASFKGTAWRGAFWATSMASTPVSFGQKMLELAEIDEDVAKWFHSGSITNHQLNGVGLLALGGRGVTSLTAEVALQTEGLELVEFYWTYRVMEISGTVGTPKSDLVDRNSMLKIQMKHFEAYNGTTDPEDYLKYVDSLLDLYGVSNKLRYLVFPKTFRSKARDWYLELSPIRLAIVINSIQCCEQLSN